MREFVTEQLFRSSGPNPNRHGSHPLNVIEHSHRSTRIHFTLIHLHSTTKTHNHNRNIVCAIVNITQCLLLVTGFPPHSNRVHFFPLVSFDLNAVLFERTKLIIVKTTAERLVCVLCCIFFFWYIFYWVLRCCVQSSLSRSKVNK